MSLSQALNQFAQNLGRYPFTLLDKLDSYLKYTLDLLGISIHPS